MIGANGIEVAGVIGIVACAMTWALSRAAAMVSRRDEKMRTFLRNDCPTCHRLEVYDSQAYNLDLGPYFTNRFETCWSCRAHRGDALEIDLDQFADAEAIRVHIGGRRSPGDWAGDTATIVGDGSLTNTAG